MRSKVNRYLRKMSACILPAALGLAAAATIPLTAAAARDTAMAGVLPAGARVAVITHGSSGGSPVDRAVGDMLTTALLRAGIRPVERQDLDSVIREQRLDRDGEVDPQSVVEAGRLLGADYLLDVRATQFGVQDHHFGGDGWMGPLAGLQIRTSTARVVLDARLVDTRTGSVIMADTGQGEHTAVGGTVAGRTDDGWRRSHVEVVDVNSHEWPQSMLGEACRKASDNLVKKLAGSMNPGAGTVLAVLPGGAAIVSLGKFDHVRAGDELRVLHVETVRDARGAIVWNEEQPSGLLRVLEVHGDQAKAAPVDDSDAPREGDVVELARR